MTVVNEDLDVPGGSAPFAKVDIELAGTGCNPITGYVNGTTVIGALRLKPSAGISANGSWQANLVPNSQITPSGTVYRITRRTSDGAQSVSCISVPATGGPYPVSELLVDPPGAIPTPQSQAVAEDLAAHEADDTAHGDPLGALATHEAQIIGDGVHGVLEHNWGRDTWDDFTIIVRTPDPAADWQRTVSDGKGVVTAVQPSGGDNLRTAAVRPSTNWADAEVRSLILPPSQWLGDNTQMGHTHRFREISPGVHEAINIWTSIVFGGDYSILHVAAVRNDGVNPTLQSAVANDTGPEAAFIDRRSAIRAHTRFSFGANFNAYRVTPTRGLLDTLEAGDLVTIADMANTTFNETGVALDGGPDLLAEQVRVIDPTHSTAVAWTDDFAGTITPAGVTAQKRWAPFYMATRVIGGTTSSVPVEIKRWRKGEPEPGWDDARVRRVDVVPNANVPAMPLGPGLHGILDAHLHDNTSQFWGDLQFRRL